MPDVQQEIVVIVFVAMLFPKTKCSQISRKGIFISRLFACLPVCQSVCQLVWLSVCWIRNL